MSRSAIRLLGLAALLSAVALLAPPIARAAPRQNGGKPVASLADEKPASSSRIRKTKKAKEDSKSDSRTGSARPAVRTLLESSPAYRDSPKK